MDTSIMTSDSANPAPSFIIFAHRGSSRDFAENTLEAFRGARNDGANGVELDARRTADQGIAVHHDARLVGGRVIVETPTNEIPEDIPRLDTALQECAGMIVNIELKNLPGEPDFDPSNQLADLVVGAVKRLGAETSVLISSFNLSSVERVRALEPSIATAWLLADFEDLHARFDRAKSLGLRAVNLPGGRTNAEMVNAAHERGLRVNVWTVDDPGQMRDLIKAGVDGIITNVPAVAREVADTFRA